MPEPAALPADLLAGYGRFRGDRYRLDRERYERLAERGQRPRTMVVACSDSRSAPEAVFDAGPGELFVVRNIAALVPVYAPDTGVHGVSAALEYAVLALAVQSIVVMGHGRCGGIAAVIEHREPLSAADFVGRWVAGLRQLEAATGTELERRVVERSLENLRTFPWIRERVARGGLELHGAWFDIALGELHVLSSDGWRPVPAAGQGGRPAVRPAAPRGP